MLVGGLGVPGRMLAMFLSRHCVGLCLLVLALVVMVRRLMVVVCRSMMVGGRRVMMLAGGVLHFSHFETPQNETRL
jgi:hypothetical protein